MPSGRAAGAGLAAVCAGGIAIALASSTACVPHQCDPSSATFDLGKRGTSFTDTEGNIVLASGPYAGTWLPYPANVTYTVTYPAGFVPLSQISVAVSTGAGPGLGRDLHHGFGAGLDQISDPSNAGFKLNNGSCADYYVWFEVRATSLPWRTRAPTDPPHIDTPPALPQSPRVRSRRGAGTGQSSRRRRRGSAAAPRGSIRGVHPGSRQRALRSAGRLAGRHVLQAERRRDGRGGDDDRGLPLRCDCARLGLGAGAP